MSSRQISNAARICFPFAATPPVSAMLKPILIGSAACAGMERGTSAVSAQANLHSMLFLPGRTASMHRRCLVDCAVGWATAPACPRGQNRLSRGCPRGSDVQGDFAHPTGSPPRIAARECVVVILLRQVGDFPPHLVHVLQAERADAVLFGDRLDAADAVLLLVRLGGGVRRVDLGGARDRELEAVLRPLLLVLALDADADHRPRPALPQILRLRQRADHVDRSEEHTSELQSPYVISY